MKVTRFEEGDEVTLAESASQTDNYREVCSMNHGDIGTVESVSGGRVYVLFGGERYWYTADELAGHTDAVSSLGWPTYKEIRAVLRRASGLLDPCEGVPVGTPSQLYELIIKLADKVEEQNEEIAKLTHSQTSLDRSIEELSSEFFGGAYSSGMEEHMRAVIRAAKASQ